MWVPLLREISHMRRTTLNSLPECRHPLRSLPKILNCSCVLVLVIVASAPTADFQTLGSDFVNEYELEILQSVPGVPDN